MTIYVTGDSWSSEGWPEGREIGYAPHECLGAQLQKITTRFVSVLAEPGDSDINQFSKMEKRINPHHPTVIVHGWSDWGRSLDFHYDNLNFTYGDPVQLRSYDSARENAHTRVSQRLRELDHMFDNITWLHWGAHSTVWADLPPNHIKLYDYYANTRVRCPVSDSGIETWSRTNYFANLFPWTPADQRRQINNKLKKLNAFKNNNPKYFPDRGHLAWRLYDDLVKKISTYI